MFVAGGIGVTPFRSISMDDFLSAGAFPFSFFTVNHFFEASIFREEFEKMARENRKLYLDQIISRGGIDPLPPGIDVGALTPGPSF